MHEQPVRNIDGCRVLMIDDEAAIRESLRRYLERLGAVVVPAPDAESGIRLFAQSAFDVVVTDLSLPGLNGLDVRRAVRTLRPDVPVILMTGALAPDVPRTELADWELLLKPFDLRQLGSAVAQALDSRAA